MCVREGGEVERKRMEKKAIICRVLIDLHCMRDPEFWYLELNFDMISETCQLIVRVSSQTKRNMSDKQLMIVDRIAYIFQRVGSQTWCRSISYMV